MMFDRVQMKTQTIGTGTYTVAPVGGALRDIAEAMTANGLVAPIKLDYFVYDAATGNFEAGQGTFDGVDQLTRDEIEDSRPAGGPVNWGPNWKNVVTGPNGKLQNRLHQGIYCGLAGGSANAITVDPEYPLPDITEGLVLHIIATADNSAATTVLGAAVQLNGYALAGGEILGGTLFSVRREGSTWQLQQSEITTELPAQIAHTGMVSPAAINTDQDNYAPVDASDAYRTWARSSGVILNLTGNVNITGIGGGRKGRRATYVNPTAYTVTMPALSASSTAINRLRAEVVIKPGTAVEFHHDGTYWNPITGSGGGGASRGHIYRLNRSNNVSDPTNDIDFTDGEAVSEVAPYPLMVLAAGVTRELDAAYGTGNGGRFDSAISDGDWNCFLISNGVTTSIGYSKLANPTSAPNYPSGYTHYRYIGAIHRVSGVILGFTQAGDDISFKLTRMLHNTSLAGSTDANLVPSVPQGRRVPVRFNISVSGSTLAWVRDGDQIADTPNATALPLATASAGNGNGVAITNLSGLIIARQNNTAPLYIAQTGYLDDRGRNG